MKPTVVVDEMFPEGAGPYMELEEVKILYSKIYIYFFIYYNIICLLLHFHPPGGCFIGWNSHGLGSERKGRPLGFFQW